MQNGPARKQKKLKKNNNRKKSKDKSADWRPATPPLLAGCRLAAINLNCFAFSYATLRSFCRLTGNRQQEHRQRHNGNKNCRFVTAIVVYFLYIFFLSSCWPDDSGLFFCLRRVPVITFYAGCFFLSASLYLFLEFFAPFVLCFSGFISPKCLRVIKRLNCQIWYIPESLSPSVLLRSWQICRYSRRLDRIVFWFRKSPAAAAAAAAACRCSLSVSCPRLFSNTFFSGDSKKCDKVLGALR